MIVTGSEIASFELEMADFWTKVANLRPKIAMIKLAFFKELAFLPTLPRTFRDPLFQIGKQLVHP